MLYFAVTTLSTVGFGDYHPVSVYERAIMTAILLSGVMIFSLLMGTFLSVLHHYKEVTKENEDSENLSRFFGLMQKFNYGTPMKKETIRKYEEFFEFHWSRDKLVFINNEDN